MLGEKHYTASVVDERMRAGIGGMILTGDRGVTIQSHSLRHKRHFYCPGIDPELPQ